MVLVGGGRFFMSEVPLHTPDIAVCILFSDGPHTVISSNLCTPGAGREVLCKLWPTFRGTSLKRNHHPVGPYVGLCLGPYGGPMGVAVSYE